MGVWDYHCHWAALTAGYVALCSHGKHVTAVFLTCVHRLRKENKRVTGGGEQSGCIGGRSCFVLVFLTQTYSNSSTTDILLEICPYYVLIFCVFVASS